MSDDDHDRDERLTLDERIALDRQRDPFWRWQRWAYAVACNAFREAASRGRRKR